jgi:hypothetical protein
MTSRLVGSYGHFRMTGKREVNWIEAAFTG